MSVSFIWSYINRNSVLKVTFFSKNYKLFYIFSLNDVFVQQTDSMYVIPDGILFIKITHHPFLKLKKI